MRRVAPLVLLMAALPLLALKLPPVPAAAGLAWLALAAMPYLAAHAVRVLRLAVILGERASGLQDVAIAHLASAPVAAALPFKLGEAWRLWLLAGAGGGLGPAFAALWIERGFDALALLLVGAAVALALPGALVPAWPVLAAAGLFLLASLLAVYVIPENLAALKLALIRRGGGRAALRLLAGLHQVRALLACAGSLLGGKLVTLALLTAAVWGCEGLALATLLAGPVAPGPVAPGQVASVLLAALSAELGPALLALLPASAAAALAGYRLVVAAALVLAGLAAIGRRWWRGREARA